MLYSGGKEPIDYFKQFIKPLDKCMEAKLPNANIHMVGDNYQMREDMFNFWNPHSKNNCVKVMVSTNEDQDWKVGYWN